MQKNHKNKTVSNTSANWLDHFKNSKHEAAANTFGSWDEQLPNLPYITKTKNNHEKGKHNNFSSQNWDKNIFIQRSDPNPVELNKESDQGDCDYDLWSV